MTTSSERLDRRCTVAYVDIDVDNRQAGRTNVSAFGDAGQLGSPKALRRRDIVVIEHSTLYINGQWVDPVSTDIIEVISPHTEQVVGRVPASNSADIDAAIDAARSAQTGEWGAATPHQRADMISDLLATYTPHVDEAARLQVTEMGCPTTQVRPMMIDPAIAILDYYANLAAGYEDAEQRTGPVGLTSVVRRKPVGIVGAVIPWNAPTYLAMLKLGPALVTGCSVVLKTAPEAPLSLRPLAEAAMAAGLPAGVLNIVSGGREAGEYLVSHPGIDKVSFTGSVATGRRIAELTGPRFIPTTLELGGKSAAIVLSDANIESTVVGLGVNCFVNSGQVCAVDSRVLVPRSLADEFTEAFSAMVGSLRTGDPADPATNIGPLVTSRQRDRVESYIRGAIDDGARLVTGGSRPQDQPTGWYVQPTVFDEVTPDMSIAKEEVFGPVVTILTYDTTDEAISIANSTEYGLAGSIWSTDTEHALALSKRIATGIVALNGFGCQFNTPFGGVKSSGLGREMGPESLEAYTEYQSVLLPCAG
jgi:aldehyde dehydrogenase (NAD+)